MSKQVLVALHQVFSAQMQDFQLHMARTIENTEDVKSVVQVLEKVCPTSNRNTLSLTACILFLLTSCGQSPQVNKMHLHIEEALRPIEDVHSMIRRLGVQVIAQVIDACTTRPSYQNTCRWCVVWSQHSMEEEDMMSDLRVAWQKVR